MDKLNIACVGAHPDDVELSMGGSILKIREAGHNVTIIDLTDGEPTPHGSREIRRGESSCSKSRLGVDRITLDLPNRFLEDNIDARKKLAEVFRKIRPDYIFTHFEYDDHPDHKAACSLVEAARFYSKLTKSDISGEPFYPAKIIYYFPNHISLNIVPSFCVDISEHLAAKKEVLECYESQFQKKDSGKMILRIMDVNRYFGFRIQKDAAEPFFTRDAVDIIATGKLFSR